MLTSTTHPLYLTWRGMLARCHNPNNPAYKDYGARGIIVCERWRIKGEGFRNFVSDMGERPEKHTIERIDNNGNYEPSNCKWASKKEQQNNRRNTRKITIEGITYNARELAQKYGFKTDSLMERAKVCTTFTDLVDKQKRVFTEGLKIGIKASAEARKARTHCANGHEYTEQSTYIQKSGKYEWRKCRICHAQRQKVINKRNQEKRNESK